MNKNNIKKQLFSLFKVNIGVIGAAISVAFFLGPNNIAGGGLSGLGILVRDFLPSFLSLSSFILICNVILLIIALFLMGKEYFLKTCFGAIMYPIYLWIFDLILVNLPDSLNIEIDMYLAVIFGAFFMAGGMGIAMRNGATTGGGDIIQSIVFKYFHIPMSKTMYAFDGALVVLSIFVFKDVSLTLSTILYIFLAGIILDNVVFGGFNKRALYIISDKHDEIKSAIIKDFVRGVTKLNATGGYNNEDKPVLVCLLCTNEYFELRNVIDKIDPHAFTYVTKATEVRGFGFSLESEARMNAKMNKRKRDLDEKK